MSLETQIQKIEQEIKDAKSIAVKEALNDRRNILVEKMKREIQETLDVADAKIQLELNHLRAVRAKAKVRSKRLKLLIKAKEEYTSEPNIQAYEKVIDNLPETAKFTTVNGRSQTILL